MTISSTPAKDIPTKDLDFNTEALADCLDQLSFVPKTVLDISLGRAGSSESRGAS
jgi:hypothetical protein